MFHMLVILILFYAQKIQTIQQIDRKMEVTRIVIDSKIGIHDSINLKNKYPNIKKKRK